MLQAKFIQNKNLPKAYLGIDPGATGCICLIAGTRIHFWEWKDADKARDVLERWNYEYNLSVILEKVHSTPNDGHVGAFKFGVNFGTWQGLLSALHIDYQTATPQQWHKFISRYKAKPKRKRGVKTDTKQWSLDAAGVMYPKLNKIIYLKKHHNRSDALLIAHYCKARR